MLSSFGSLQAYQYVTKKKTNLKKETERLFLTSALIVLSTLFLIFIPFLSSSILQTVLVSSALYFVYNAYCVLKKIYTKYFKQGEKNRDTIENALKIIAIDQPTLAVKIQSVLEQINSQNISELVKNYLKNMAIHNPEKAFSLISSINISKEILADVDQFIKDKFYNVVFSSSSETQDLLKLAENLKEISKLMNTVRKSTKDKFLDYIVDSACFTKDYFNAYEVLNLIHSIKEIDEIISSIPDTNIQNYLDKRFIITSMHKVEKRIELIEFCNQVASGEVNLDKKKLLDTSHPNDQKRILFTQIEIIINEINVKSTVSKISLTNLIDEKNEKNCVEPNFHDMVGNAL